MTYRGFRPLLKERANRHFLTADAKAAVDFLRNDGFQGAVLVDHGKVETLTKVFIAPYDNELDPEWLRLID